MGIYWWFFLITVLGLFLFKIVYYLQSGTCYSTRRLEGKVAIITGASAGIGKETALDLAKRGARVILACRNLSKAQKVADNIISRSGNHQVIVRRVDTSDLCSVREFANGILTTERNLHILINNAGIGGTNIKKTTSNGLELTMATNHFGHFLLTNMLLGLMKKSAPARVINVTSIAHWACRSLPLDDLNFESRKFPGWLGTYGQSKLCNILFTVELAEKLRGTGVTVNSVHPGMVHTGLVWNEGYGILDYVANFLLWFLVKNAKLGAQPIIYLAVSKDVEHTSGKYFVDCKETRTSSLGRNHILARKLWNVSERMVSLGTSEIHY